MYRRGFEHPKNGTANLSENQEREVGKTEDPIFTNDPGVNRPQRGRTCTTGISVILIKKYNDPVDTQSSLVFEVRMRWWLWQQRKENEKERIRVVGGYERRLPRIVTSR